MAEGKWQHATHNSVLLYDEMDAACVEPIGCGALTTYVENKVKAATDASDVAGYLCTESKIKTSAKEFTCSGQTYYSYMNALNPAPCAEILLTYAANMYPIPAGTQLETFPWQPMESFAQCLESYVGSITAYFAIYMASDLESLRSSEGLDQMIFYAAWGLMWIHSAYANYDLCANSYGSFASMDGLGENPWDTFSNGDGTYKSLVDFTFEGDFEWVVTTSSSWSCKFMKRRYTSCMYRAKRYRRGSPAKCEKYYGSATFQRQCVSGDLVTSGITWDLDIDEALLQDMIDAAHDA